MANDRDPPRGQVFPPRMHRPEPIPAPNEAHSYQYAKESVYHGLFLWPLAHLPHLTRRKNANELRVCAGITTPDEKQRDEWLDWGVGLEVRFGYVIFQHRSSGNRSAFSFLRGVGRHQETAHKVSHYLDRFEEHALANRDMSARYATAIEEAGRVINEENQRIQQQDAAAWVKSYLPYDRGCPFDAEVPDPLFFQQFMGGAPGAPRYTQHLAFHLLTHGGTRQSIPYLRYFLLQTFAGLLPATSADIKTFPKNFGDTIRDLFGEFERREQQRGRTPNLVKLREVLGTPDAPKTNQQSDNQQRARYKKKMLLDMKAAADRSIEEGCALCLRLGQSGEDRQTA